MRIMTLIALFVALQVQAGDKPNPKYDAFDDETKRKIAVVEDVAGDANAEKVRTIFEGWGEYATMLNELLNDDVSQSGYTPTSQEQKSERKREHKSSSEFGTFAIDGAIAEMKNMRIEIDFNKPIVKKRAKHPTPFTVRGSLRRSPSTRARFVRLNNETKLSLAYRAQLARAQSRERAQ